MPVGVTPISREVYGLHMMIFWVCVAIAVVVFGAMIYSIWKFRKSAGAVPDPTLTHSTKVEVVWTVIPVVILIAMAIPAASTLIDDGGHAQLRAHRQGHRLPVEVAVRLPRQGRQPSTRRWPPSRTRRAS